MAVTAAGVSEGPQQGWFWEYGENLETRTPCCWNQFPLPGWMKGHRWGDGDRMEWQAETFLPGTALHSLGSPIGRTYPGISWQSRNRVGPNASPSFTRWHIQGWVWGQGLIASEPVCGGDGEPWGWARGSVASLSPSIGLTTIPPAAGGGTRPLTPWSSTTSTGYSPWAGETRIPGTGSLFCVSQSIQEEFLAWSEKLPTRWLQENFQSLGHPSFISWFFFLFFFSFSFYPPWSVNKSLDI